MTHVLPNISTVNSFFQPPSCNTFILHNVNTPVPFIEDTLLINARLARLFIINENSRPLSWKKDAADWKLRGSLSLCRSGVQLWSNAD